MYRLTIGDKVTISKEGNARFPSYPLDKVFTVVGCEYCNERGEPVVYSSASKNGWINESMGLYKIFKLYTAIHVGGE